MSEKLLIDLHVTTMLTSISSVGGWLAIQTTGSLPTGIILTIVLFIVGQAFNVFFNLVMKPWWEERKTRRFQKILEENERLKQQLLARKDTQSGFARLGFLLVFALILSSVFLLTAKSCNKSQVDKVLRNLHVEVPRFPLPNSYTTPAGAKVGTVNPIPPEKQTAVFASIDEGLNRLFLSTNHLGYSNFRNHADFIVIMAPPTSRSEYGNCPTLNLKNGLKIAGTVIGVAGVNISPPFLLVAENYDESPICNELLRDATRFEGEHLEAWENDRRKFLETTGAGDMHPIFPLPDGQLTEKQFEHFDCGLTGITEKQPTTKGK